MSIATIIAFIIRYRKWFAYGAAAFAVVLALWWLYSAVWQRGYDAADEKWKAAQRAAEDKAAQDTIQLQDAMAGIDAGVAIELEAIENVRVVYRDKIRTVAIAADRPDCAIADGLRAQINAAASDYASATSASGPAVRPAKPSP